MKKTQKCSFFILIFVVFLLIIQNFNIFSIYSLEKLNNNFSQCYSKNIDNYREYNFYYGNKIYRYKSNDFKFEYTNIQKMAKIEDFNKIAQRLLNMGFSKSEIILYILPEIKPILKELEKKININPQEDYVSVVKNSCEIVYNQNQNGRFLNENVFFDEIFNQIIQNKNKFNINIKTEEYQKNVDIKQDFQEKGYFETNFSTSSNERKNNIKLALSKFDGLVISSGECFSFNSVTGRRNEDAGYKSAKIIMDGTFVNGFGGGVCQVSTTIYNASLIAGLEIVEVHQHSLPVSYVEPSFDAMVNSGSSDLIIRNNTSGKIIITTSSKNDKCCVKIFGQKNKYKIKRESEKIQSIPASEDVIENDYLKYGLEDLEIGDEYRLSYSKDGYTSVGYLNFYDEKGNFIKKQKIRQNKYNATKGVVVKREN